MTKCQSCGKKLNPVQAMLGNVCGKCTREAHKQAIGQFGAWIDAAKDLVEICDGDAELAAQIIRDAAAP